MSRLQKILISWLKKLLSDSHSAIIGIIFGSIFAGGTGVYFFSKNLWNLLIDIAQLPTPLWATIALVLLVGVYIYLKKSRNQSCSKAILYPVDNLKWEVTINNTGNYHVSKTPYCKKHELKLAQSTNHAAWNCPKLLECHTKINNSNIRNLRRKALSHIEKAVRDKKIKC